MIEKMIKVLWVEDESNTNLVELKMYLMMVDDIELEIAQNATEAERIIASRGVEFDVIIVDIRILAGYGDEWLKYYDNHEQRIGAYLVNKIYKDYPKLYDRLGIYSIERKEDTEELMLKKDGQPIMPPYLRKIRTIPETEVEQFIRNIAAKRN
jgi:hypothetical protein